MKSRESGNRQIEVPRVASLGQSGGEKVQASTQLSPLTTLVCLETLQGLNNAFAAVLMNAQALDGKLPNYSRSKRYIHEIERNAQRGGALLKRLLERLPVEEARCDDGEFEVGEVPPVAERTAVVASQGPIAATDSAFGYAPSAAADTAPAFSPRWMSAHRRV